MSRGPGTHTKILVSKIFGVKVGGCGGCQQLLEKMDRLGCEWCREHIGELVPTIRSNARKSRNWFAKGIAFFPGSSAPIWALLHLAISNAEAEAAAEQAAQEQKNSDSCP